MTDFLGIFSGSALCVINLEITTPAQVCDITFLDFWRQGSDSFFCLKNN
jgi:hypothetical protein